MTYIFLLFSYIKNEFYLPPIRQMNLS